MLYFIPLLAALIYPIGSLWYKQAQQHGAGPWRSTILSNWVMTVCFLPLALFHWDAPDWSLLYWPVLSGLAFFLGQLFTVMAVHAGDVSVQAPMMGTKTIFVALCSTFWLQAEEVSLTLWIATGLTALAVFLLGGAGLANFRKLRVAVMYAIASCIFFAATDSIVAAKGAGFGPTAMLIFSMLSLSVISLLFWPMAARESTTPRANRLLLYGGLAYGLQALILGIGLSFFGRATHINVVYASRGLFGIALVWFLGHWFGNRERRETGRTVMLQRVGGAVLLMLAIALTLV